MKRYSVMPQDWDYAHEQEIKELMEKGCYTPYDIKEVVESCGSLSFITTKTSAIEYVKNLKKKFPFIAFDLLTGESWGKWELVKSFQDKPKIKEGN